MVKKKGKNAKGKGQDAAVAVPAGPSTSEASSLQASPDKDRSETSSVTSHHSGEQGTGPSGRGLGRGRGDGLGRGRGRGRGAGGHPKYPGAESDASGDPRGTSYEQQRPGPPQQQSAPWAGHGGQQQQGPPQQQQGPPQQQQGPRQQQRGSPQQQQGSPQQQQGPPQQQQGPPQQQQGSPQQQQGPPQQQQGSPQEQQGPPQQQRGSPQQQQGSPQQQYGAKGSWKKGQQQGSPANVGAASPARGEGPTPSEGPRSFQATSPKESQELLTPSPPGDQKLISMKKGIGDMSINGNEKKVVGVQSKALQIPHRKDYSKCGHSGRRTKILTNHLALDLSALAKTTVFHYDVSIDPDKPKRLMRLVIEAAKKKLFPTRFPAFDGKKNLYSAGSLQLKNNGKAEVKVWDEEREREKDYVVVIKQVAQIDMSSLTSYMKMSQPVPQTAIQALDIILRTAPAFKMVQVGRSFFSAPRGEVRDLGNGLEVWHGIFQSAIIGWKPFVNIDVAHKGFPKSQNCIKLIEDLIKNPFDRYNQGGPNLNNELGLHERDNLMKFLRELKVNYEVPNNPTSKRTYRVNGIGKSARTQRFPMDDGTEMSVEEYYSKIKKCNLLYPHMPVLDVGSPQRIKKIYIPLELCVVKEGQVVIKKMNELQTSEMIKVAATPSDDRKRKIMDAMKTIDFNSDPCVSKEFKLSVAKDFEVVESRVLDPPSLMYGQNRTVNVNKGVWFAGQFLEGKKLTRWTILNLSRTSAPDLKMFADQMQTQGRKAGMDVAPPMEPFHNIQLGRRVMDDLRVLEGLFTEFKTREMEIVFCVVEERGDAYAQVKRMAELKVGVLTQCIKSVTIQRRMRSPATADNILMKVNSKLNGKNHTFSAMSRPKCLSVPVMIVGADVTHPPPDQTNTPSVAAVCASHDPKAFQYNLQYRLQPPRMEIIEDLEEIMKEQLKFFYSKNKQKPQKIIFYRDGVSEGQFNEVLNVEFMAIRRACTSLQATYEPGITFLVVQKRHHTRFFPDPNNKNPADHDGKNNNVPAGTIVDTIITHPTDMDFYLVSHASIQGVSRPTKYRRLWDDNDIPEDELELLTYYLCHMFSRCSRSVSYPAPTYNAHLAAYRVRCYLETGQGFSIKNLKDEQSRRKILDCILKEFPMFFV